MDLTVSDMVNMTDETHLEQKFLVKCVADAFWIIEFCFLSEICMHSFAKKTPAYLQEERFAQFKFFPDKVEICGWHNQGCIVVNSLVEVDN